MDVWEVKGHLQGQKHQEYLEEERIPGSLSW